MPAQIDSLRGWSPRVPSRLSSGAPCPSIAVTSGKGGVGKSNLSLSIALSLADIGRRVLLVDGDMGLANLHILCGVHPERTLDDVLEGRCSPAQALVELDSGVNLLPSASGIANLSALPADRVSELGRALAELQGRHDVLVVDTGAGIGDTTLNLVLAADRALLVTTPEPTAQADAYAMLKVLRSRRTDLPTGVCVNMASGEDEAMRAGTRLTQVCARFLGWEPSWSGWIPRQAGLERHVLERRPAFRAEPESAFARAVRALSRELLDGLGGSSGFFERVAGTRPGDIS